MPPQRSPCVMLHQQLSIYIAFNVMPRNPDAEVVPFAGLDLLSYDALFDTFSVNLFKENYIALQGICPEYEVVIDVPNAEGYTASPVNVAVNRFDIDTYRTF